MEEHNRWNLRVRGPKGLLANLELPQGSRTTITEVKKLAGKLTRVAANKVRLRAGFPPQDVISHMDGAPCTVETAGLKDKDTIIVERRVDGLDSRVQVVEKVASELDPGTSQVSFHNSPRSDLKKELPRKSFESNPETPVRTKGAAAGTQVLSPRPSGEVPRHDGQIKRRRKITIQGKGRRLGYSDEGEHPSDGDYTLGKASSSAQYVENRLAAELFHAASGSGTQLTTSVHKSLRGSLREARKKAGAESEANLKVTASLLGRVKFRELDDGSGRLEVEYQVGSRGATRKELVSGIPSLLLPAILKVVASDEDALARSNLKPSAMALVSPRMFWAIVRHGEVGPGRSFHDALTTLAPEINWLEIEKRDRQKPERYADYVSH